MYRNADLKNLAIGFREQPVDLDDTLSQIGFKKDGSKYKLPSHVEWNSLCVEYHTPLARSELWQSIDPDIVAEASILNNGGPQHFKREIEVAKFLQDRYGAIVVDSQAPLDDRVLEIQEIESTRCAECTKFRTEDLHGHSWYNQYCAGAPYTDAEKKDMEKREEEHFKHWMESTDGGRLCKIPFAPGSGSYAGPSKLQKNYHNARHIRSGSDYCPKFKPIDQMKWADVFIILPRMIGGEKVAITTVLRRKRRSVKQGAGCWSPTHFKSRREYRLQPAERT